ncbi:RNA polymerase sigma factor [Streptomyces nanhaiensis]|uniref:RNA polymerase sigma factor n=1 Tax=Streptomyces nanhaiensis TaxID=679319 RepID=UPI00399C89A7
MTAEPGTEASRRGDARVIERSQDEPEAFAELFDRHSAAVHRYVARRLGTQAADDLTADTFAAAFQQRHRYDTGRADARPWLFGIATNLVGRHRRAEARRFRALSRLPAPVDHGQGVAEPATARADAFLVGHRPAAALAALPAPGRDARHGTGRHRLAGRHDPADPGPAPPLGAARRARRCADRSGRSRP